MTTLRSRPAVSGTLFLILFALVTYAVVAVPAIGRIDTAVDTAVAPLRTGPLLAVFVWITTLGAGATLFAVAVTTTAFLWTGTGRPFIGRFWTVYLGTEAMTWGTKFALGRARPVFLDVASAVSPSFPSAHTAGAAAVYGFLAYLLIQRLSGSGPIRAVVLAGAALVIAAVAISRVILSVHFFSDVIGGLALAGAWMFVGVGISPVTRGGRT